MARREKDRRERRGFFERRQDEREQRRHLSEWLGSTHIGRHWSAESRTISVGLVAHGVSALTGLLAGVALAAVTGTLQRLPGFILVVLASNGLRGNIFGAFGSRLGTAIQVGSYEPTLRRGSVLRTNILAVGVLTVATAPLLAVLALGVGWVLGRPSMGLWDFLVVAILGALLSSVVVGLVSSAVAWAAARFDWDLDTVAAPLVTMAGDVVGVPALALAAMLAGHGTVTVASAVPLVLGCVGFGAWAAVRMESRARQIVRESAPVLLVVAAVDLLAGAVLQAQETKLFRYEVLLVLLPSFLEALGGFGGMYASRLSTKLHLGVVERHAIPDRLAVLDSTLVLLFALAIFPVMAACAWGIGIVSGLSSLSFWGVLEVTIAGGTLATILALTTGYYAALSTVRFGLDPDNHALPIVCSVMDLLGVLCLALALRGLT